MHLIQQVVKSAKMTYSEIMWEMDAIELERGYWTACIGYAGSNFVPFSS
jgi:hypothetical protein